MKLSVNGQEKDVPDGLTISGLLKFLGIDVRAVAVERNRAIVPRSEHPAAKLNDGDNIEIVTFVQGG